MNFHRSLVIVTIVLNFTSTVMADDSSMVAATNAPSADTTNVANLPTNTTVSAGVSNAPAEAMASTNTPIIPSNIAETTNILTTPPQADSTTVSVAPSPAVETTNTLIVPPPAYSPFTIGAEVGTTGAGIAVRWKFSDQFGLGAAYDRLSVSGSGTIEDNLYHARLRLESEPLTFDWYPLKNDYFHVSGGILFNQNHFTGTSSGTVDLNGTPYAGTARLDIKQQPVDPYLGVGGNFYFDKHRHFSMGGEMGLAFTGKPRVHLTLNPPSGAVETQRQQEEAKIRHYARFAQLWPVLKLNLNYSF